MRRAFLSPNALVALTTFAASIILAAGCDRLSKARPQSISVNPADSILIPERRVRFYRDPDTNEPDLTLVVSLQLDGKKRFILAQTKVQEGSLAIVSDSAGLIPVFESEREAREYIARVFPLNAGGAESPDDTVVAAYAEMLGKQGATHVEFDRALAWAANPSSRDVGPLELASVWEVLSGADAAYPRAPFDPMSMPMVDERIRRNDADSTAARIAMMGMMLSGIISEAQRRGAGDDAPWPAGLDSVWTSADDALLARIIRTGVAHMAPRLSSDAAKRDVTTTWPAPRGPLPTASFMSGAAGTTTFNAELREPARLTPQAINEYVNGQVSNTTEPERAAVSAIARARYASDRRAYAQDLRAYIQASRAHEDEARRMVGMRVWLKNEGDREAKQLSVRFHVPRGLVVIASGMNRLPPLSPDEPLTPSAYEDRSAARKPWDPRPRPTYRESGQTSMYNNAQQIIAGTGGTTIVEHRVVQIPGKSGGEAGELLVQFPDWHSVKPFDLDVEILVGGEPVSTTRLHVNATARPL